MALAVLSSKVTEIGDMVEALRALVAVVQAGKLAGVVLPADYRQALVAEYQRLVGELKVLVASL